MVPTLPYTDFCGSIIGKRTCAASGNSPLPHTQLAPSLAHHWIPSSSKRGIIARSFHQPPDPVILIIQLPLSTSSFRPLTLHPTSLVFSEPSHPNLNRTCRSHRAPDSFPSIPSVGGGGGLSRGPDNLLSSPPIGGHLSLFSSQWESSTDDSWVLHAIS